jgi:hypothetical protein
MEPQRSLLLSTTDFIIVPFISDDDLKQAIRRLKSLKSFGLDGIPSFIIKDCSKINFCSAIKCLYNCNLLPSDVNSLQDWCIANYIKLSISKAKIISFSGIT